MGCLATELEGGGPNKLGWGKGCIYIKEQFKQIFPVFLIWVFRKVPNTHRVDFVPPPLQVTPITLVYSLCPWQAIIWKDYELIALLLRN